MTNAKVRFFDDETMVGEIVQTPLEDPDFMLDIGAGGLENNQSAWVSLNAVKWIELPLPEEAEAKTAEELRKVAIRFNDGEVLRGRLGEAVERHRHGLLLDLYPEQMEGQDRVRRLAVPFTAIKAVFFVRQFDSRNVVDQGAASDAYVTKRTIAPLLDVLDAMDMIQRMRESGLLDESEYELKRTQILERL